MKRGGKLSIALHILAHLAEAGERPTTSEALAEHLLTNPVVVRRSLAGLRKAGIVTSVKGHGGGWTVARPPTAVSLRDIYQAFGSTGELVPIPEPPADRCLIQASVNDALNGFYAEAEQLLLRRLAKISLADLTTSVRSHITTGPDPERSSGKPSA